MNRLIHVALGAALATGCSSQPAHGPMQYGGDPQLLAQHRRLLPTMKIADPAPRGGQRPTVPPGYTVTDIATGFGVARQTLVLPNGDIVVAEGRGGGEAALRRCGPRTSSLPSSRRRHQFGKSGNRLTLLCDANGDGVYETRTVFADHLNAPYGLALAGRQIHVGD